MGRILSKLKQAGQTLRDGESYVRFGEHPARSESRHQRALRDRPIQELGVLTMGTGAAISVAGAVVEFSHVLGGEVVDMTMYAGLGGVAIGGMIYAFGKTSE